MKEMLEREKERRRGREQSKRDTLKRGRCRDKERWMRGILERGGIRKGYKRRKKKCSETFWGCY